MIRLVALACGLLCGTGLLLSGLYHPSLAQEVGAQEGGPIGHGLAIFVIVVVASALASIASNRTTPLLGGTEEELPNWSGRKPLISALVFGLGWGLSGYVPLAAFASAGALAPGAVVFLTSALFGMVLVDVLMGKRSFGSGRNGSVG